MDSFGSWGGVVAALPVTLCELPVTWSTGNEQQGRHHTAALPCPARLSCCIFSGCCNLCKAAKPMISCSCGSGALTLSQYLSPTASLPPRPEQEWFSCVREFLQAPFSPSTSPGCGCWFPGRAELGRALQLAEKQHGTAQPAFWCLFQGSQVTLFLSVSKLISSLHVISLYLRLQGFGQVLLFWFFSFLAFTKMHQRHNLLQWNCERTNQNWHLLTSNSFVPRRQEIKRQLIWANKPIFYVFLRSFSL